MAGDARSGLKQLVRANRVHVQFQGEKVVEARSGLKHKRIVRWKLAEDGQKGRGCPFGVETISLTAY